MADKVYNASAINIIAEFISDPSRIISIPNPISFEPTVNEGIETSTLGEYIKNVETHVKNNNLLVGNDGSNFVRFTNPVSYVATSKLIFDLGFYLSDDGDIELYGADGELDDVSTQPMNISSMILQLLTTTVVTLPDNFTSSSYWYVPHFYNNLCNITEDDDLFSEYSGSVLTADYCLQIISSTGVISVYSLEGVAVNHSTRTNADNYEYELDLISISQDVLPVGCIFRLCYK